MVEQSNVLRVETLLLLRQKTWDDLAWYFAWSDAYYLQTDCTQKEVAEFLQTAEPYNALNAMKRVAELDPETLVDNIQYMTDFFDAQGGS